MGTTKLLRIGFKRDLDYADKVSEIYTALKKEGIPYNLNGFETKGNNTFWKITVPDDFLDKAVEVLNKTGYKILISDHHPLL